MTKAEKFLWIVQTTTLANAVNLASIPERAEQYRHVISASGALTIADEALDASQLIPEEMTAFEAAHEFCTFMLANLKETEEKAAGEKMVVPAWFARG
jgi:hypothetical protein